MKYEEYIEAIAPFEDFKNRANNCILSFLLRGGYIG